MDGEEQRLTRRGLVIGAGSTTLLAGVGAIGSGCGAMPPRLRVLRAFSLPAPRARGRVSLEEALARRRSRRDYTKRTLTEQEISQLLWAAQGITADWGGRTGPSAGALYPLELYALTAAGQFHYQPRGHRLELLAERDLRGEAAAAALAQPAVAGAALTLVITAVYARATGKYGSRGRRYVALEAGHVAQNVLLQVVALGLAAVPIGSFDDRRLSRTLSLPADHEPLYILAVGHPRAASA